MGLYSCSEQALWDPEVKCTTTESLLAASSMSSAQTYREHSLSPGDRAALAKQSARLKKNDQLLQLRKDTMLPRIIGKMAGLKTEICQTFARLGQACKQDCIGKFSANRISYLGSFAKCKHM